ncbi:hypothetical protein [Nostoc sp. 2RC]|uniref:pPIWI_RE_Z domain-containing protein n=1 Tax=Nostoc sp. 2RC TaxID=2485484 RepID=UPI001625E2E0|nr:hypothetical protein [Nostoc sp. 2RC]MBC1237368.1 hypothetical protein [Nostoc sp. 2RC]
MRDWQAWLKDISTQLLALEQEGILEKGTFSSRIKCYRFFQIELVIALHEQVYEQSNNNLNSAWSLLTGFIPSEVSNDTNLIRKCQIVRHRARYIRTATAWNRSLEWYAELPRIIRLYDIDVESYRYERRAMLHFILDRMAAIRNAIDQPAAHTIPKINYAQPNKEYSFFIGLDEYSITISPELLEGVTDLEQNIPTPQALQPKNRKNPPEPLTIRMSDLKASAIELNKKLPIRDWLEGYEKLNLLQVSDCLVSTEEITIDGIYHLLGPTGAGKTTVIQLLIYHLIKQQDFNHNYRICIIFNTVNEVLEMAADCIKMGIPAAPILGKSRDLHQYQYGMAYRSLLQPEDLYQPYDPELDPQTASLLDNPALKWLTGSCILSGLLTEGSIPPGSEPCTKLTTREDIAKKKKNAKHSVSYHHCPFINICPVHQANRDIAGASVWVATSAAFLQTSLPVNLLNTKMRLLEAANHYCDFQIFDEVDREQVFFEDRFAPSNDLAGSQTDGTQKALLDFIEYSLFETGRSPLIDSRYHELRGVVREASRLSDWIFARVFEHPHLREWIAGWPLYNSIIYKHIQDDVRNLAPDNISEAEVETCLNNLEQEFTSFYKNSFVSDDLDDDQAHPLEKLINDVQNQKGHRFGNKLRKWLNSLLPWELDQSPQTSKMLERLELGVVLTAMDSHVVALVRYWLGIAVEATEQLGNEISFTGNPPDEFIDIGVESPLGNILGYQFVDYSEEKSLNGVLRYLDCVGMGRYLLLRFPYLYVHLCGTYGPHTLFTSATSWSPGSPQYHISVRPHAILSPPPEATQRIAQSYFDFIPLPAKNGDLTRVSGLSGSERRDSLIQIAKYLAFGSGGDTVSRIASELAYWQEQGMPRGAVLITGSYNEAQAVASVLQDSSQWRDRVDCMQPDRDLQEADWFIRRGQIEQHPTRGRQILVVPLGAFQRGYNILLPGTNIAYLGSVFFLVRPYPVPTDFGRQIRAINRWVFDSILQGSNVLPEHLGTTAESAISSMRSQAYKNWGRRLRASYLGSGAMDKDLWQELLWDQLVAVTQALGRATRGGVPTRVFFCDSAFYPPRQSGRSLLKGWVEILDEYLAPDSTKSLVEQQLAKELYGAIYDQLRSLVKRLQMQNIGGK